VIAVAEFYQAGDPLMEDIVASQRQTWLIIGVVTLAMYLMLSGFIRRISNTILWQQSELSSQVTRLTDLLAQNAELHERIRRATGRATTLNERFLRRISAELHDGPAQYLGLSLLHLDRVVAYFEVHPEQPDMSEHLDVVQSSVAQAMQEVRAVSSGLGLPQLDALTLSDIAIRVVRAHERRTRTQVQFTLDELPESATLPIKITLYRILQEGLSNTYRHAGGVGACVHIWANLGTLWIEISDRGPGFQPPSMSEWDEHMGLSGMRERAESLGGRFSITSQPSQGTCISASLPLNEVQDDRE
jgi:signal transduction histidine kinase